MKTGNKVAFVICPQFEVFHHFSKISRSVFFSTPSTWIFWRRGGRTRSIAEPHANITQRALLLIEWRHELMANDWRSMSRNLTAVCFTVVFTTQWRMPLHWHASPQRCKKKRAKRKEKKKNGSGNTSARCGFACLITFSATWQIPFPPPPPPDRNRTRVSDAQKIPLSPPQPSGLDSLSGADGRKL